MKKTWPEVEAWLDQHLLDQYGHEETTDPWKTDTIETETVTSIWTDLAGHLGLPYVAQLTVNNTEDRHEDMDSKFVLFDQNDQPFFAIDFREVVGVIGNRYAGLKKEGMRKMVEAAYARFEQKPLHAVVSVRGGVADVDICPEGVEVAIIDYDALEENVADNLNDVRHLFAENDFETLVNIAKDQVVALVRSGQASDIVEACVMLDLEVIAEEAGISPLKTNPQAATAREAMVTMLEISTGHISLKTKEWIDAMDDEAAYPTLIIYPKHIYGWIIFVPQDDLEDTLSGVPEDLANLVRFAAQRGAKWIMLDADAPVISELPTFEW